MRKFQLRSAIMRQQFHGHHGLNPIRCAGDPSQFHQPIFFEPQKSSVVRMLSSFKFRFEKERHVQFALHQYRPRRRKPSIELLGPRSK